MTKFKSLEELATLGYVVEDSAAFARTVDGITLVNQHLKAGEELRIDKYARIWNSADQYIADAVEPE